MTEVAGYSGSGLSILALVFAFNITAVLLWFLLAGLRRVHEGDLEQARRFLRDAEHVRGVDKERSATVEEVREKLGKAEGLGPLWGRRPIGSALLTMHAARSRWPELREDG